MVVENPHMVVENPNMDLENLIWTSKTHMKAVSDRGLRPADPPLAPPARVMLVRGRAEYRRSLSGAREMCVSTALAGEMCVPKPFSCLFVLFFVWLLYAKNQRPDPPVIKDQLRW